MAALFGAGRDPATGNALGTPYRVYRPVADRVAEAVAALPTGMPWNEREAAVSAITAREQARGTPVAVAGFDMTFTVPKSVSVWWALADRRTQETILAAHHRAVSSALAVVESRALFTRIGHHGCAQVKTKGLIAASFDHWDSRAHDPNLHTHVVVANKVQGRDGKWRSLDSRTLHQAAVAISELYDDFLADELTATLGVRWGWRDRGRRRTAAFEVDGVSERLLSEFSTRSRVIAAAADAAMTAFARRHGRMPGRSETIRLRQHATKATRPTKTVLPLSDLVDGWRKRAHRLTRTNPRTLVAHLGRRAAPIDLEALLGGDDAARILGGLADDVIAAMMTRRSTWSRWNLAAEAARATRALRLPTAQERLELIDRVVEEAMTRCVSLEAPDLFTVSEEYRRRDGGSVFTRDAEVQFTTMGILEAEGRLMASTEDLDAAAVPSCLVAAVLADLNRAQDTGRLRLHRDQVDVVSALAASGRRVEVLIGPAGTGKTAALRALKAVWQQSFGDASVIGLAPSATAAAELAASLGVVCENTAKWLYESRAGTEGWALRSGQLVILDEASMADTATLDALVSQVQAAGAKLVLVGDPQQLSSVGAGGGFVLLAETMRAQELTALWRFRSRWEANASRLLRTGDPACLDAYTEHGRVASGSGEQMIDAAYCAWRDADAAGSSAILVAQDTETVTALNDRAHQERVACGMVTGRPVRISDGAVAAVGDRVLSRANNRLLAAGNGFVHNGDLWDVLSTHRDGSITVAPARMIKSDLDDETIRVRLPARYVREHLELGYACTTYRAQGITVERAFVVAAPGMTRQAFYVAMTRGRTGSWAFVATDDVDPTCDQLPDQPAHTRDVLERILATDGRQLSATQTLRSNQDRAGSLARLAPIRATLLADIDLAHWRRALPTCGLTVTQAKQVLDSPAAGPLFAALRRVGDAGLAPERALRLVVAQRPLPEQGDLAAVLHHRTTLLYEQLPPGTTDAADLTRASSAITAAQQLGLAGPPTTGTSGGKDAIARVIADIDDLVRARVDALTSAAVAERAAWVAQLGTPQTEDAATLAQFEAAVATIAAYRDLAQIQSAATSLRAGPGERSGRRQQRVAAHAARTARRLAGDRHDTSGVSR